MKKISDFFYKHLLVDIMPFWTKFGLDYDNGGIYTSLDQKGNLYSSDKSVWMQGRSAYVFALLYNEVEKKQEFFDAAKLCLGFSKKHCIDEDKRMFFLVTKEGKPIRKRRYYFSELFYAAANAEFYISSQKEEYLLEARKYFDLVYSIYTNDLEDPYKITPKAIAKTRNIKSLSLPMILLNTTQILRKADPQNTPNYNNIIDCIIKDIEAFQLPNTNLCLEQIGVNGEIYEDIASSRVINPGHSMELAWFLLDEAVYRENNYWKDKAQKIFDAAYNIGKDDLYGGIFYFKDYLNLPLEAYEHDMKLWWVHAEAMIAALKLYDVTKQKKYLNIFKKMKNYSFEHFVDIEFGEWFGYLRRDGKVTEPPCKGHIYKGPYHIPRMLMICAKLLAKLNL